MNLDGPEVDHNSYYLFPQRKHNSCGSHIRKATLSTKTLFCPIIPACPDPITMLQPALVKVASWSSGERPRRLLGSSSVVSPAGQGLQEQKGLRETHKLEDTPCYKHPILHAHVAHCLEELLQCNAAAPHAGRSPQQASLPSSQPYFTQAGID